MIGVVRVVGCTAVSLVMARLGRRPLMVVSSLGQAASMAVSGCATYFILRGKFYMTLYLSLLRASLL